VDAATKSNIESHIASLKTAMEGSDLQAIKTRSEELMRASHKLAETMYAQAGAAGAGSGAGAAGAQEQPKAKKPEEDVVEAEFEEVK
jgi:molecular chaperone DnaK